MVSKIQVICVVLVAVFHINVAMPGTFLAASHGIEVGGHAPSKISVEYGVADAYTGDKKSVSEVRDGDVVKGQYSVLDADGSTRTVHYTADAHNGFKAQVTRDGHPVGAPQQALGHQAQGAPLAYANHQGHGQGYTKVSRH